MVIHPRISGSESGRTAAPVFHHKHHSLIPLAAQTGKKGFCARQGNADLPVLQGPLHIIKGFAVHAGELHILHFQFVMCAGQNAATKQQANTARYRGNQAAEHFIIHQS